MILGMSPLTVCARGVELGRGLLGIRCCVRDADWRKTRRLDSAFSDHHSIDERDWFSFSVHGLLPSHVFGIISLLVLPVALYARYSRQLAGGWRRTYVITAMIALYLNVFVLIAQLFMKVPALKAMAPTQSEPPFKRTQLVVLVVFVVLTIATARKFRGDAGRAA